MLFLIEGKRKTEDPAGTVAKTANPNMRVLKEEEAMIGGPE